MLGTPLKVQPWEFATYSQVKLEFDNLIVNAGLRFDYFDADFFVPKDPQSFDGSGSSEEIRAQLKRNKTILSAESEIRCSVSIFRNRSDAIFSRFISTNPRLSLLYTNPSFIFNAESISEDLGNANLKSERTLQFEVGLQQGLTESMGLDVTVFSKDVRELTSANTILSYTGNFRSNLENIDFGTVKGVTLSLYERGKGQFAWTIDYTLQFASGSGSDPRERFNRFVNGVESSITISRLNWDKRHVFNNSLTWNSKLGLSVSVINTLQSGNPYTSYRNLVRSLKLNNEDAPTILIQI